MAAFDVEDRKRSLDLDSLNSTLTPSKRPHLDRSLSSNAPNGPSDVKGERIQAVAEEDESTPAYKGLEAFRKEAIFRLMRETKRDLLRSEANVRKLQHAFDTMSERCAAFNQFWNTLVEDVRLLAKEDRISPEHRKALFEAIPLTSRDPVNSAFSATLQERNSSLKVVLSTIVRLGPESLPEVDQLQARCHQLGEESASFRSQLATAVKDKEALTEDLEKTIDQLRRAEKKIDRIQSSTVKNTERPGEQAEEEAEQAKVEAAKAETEAAHQRKVKAEGESNGENGFESIGRANGAAYNEELEDVKKLAEMRLDECERWRMEIGALRQESEGLQHKMQAHIEASLLESQTYRELHSHAEELEKQVARIGSSFKRIESENNELREMRSDFEVTAKAEANALVDGLRNTIKSHEADLARLRIQRDELTGDVTERKHRELLRSSQVDEMKALVLSKDARITALKSEVRRLQCTLASRSGDDKLLERLRRGTEKGEAEDAEVEMIEALQDRLKAAEESSLHLKRKLEAQSSSTTDQEMSEKVVALQAELDQLSALLEGALTGDDAESASEKVKARVLRQGEEISTLRRELATSQESTNALCDELDKIGEAYNQSQKVATERVADVGRTEEQLTRLAKEKSKADTKYYAAMRLKDALETEKKVLARNLDNRSKVIDNYKEVESALRKELQQAESEVSQFRTLIDAQNCEVISRDQEVQRQSMASQRAARAQAEAEEMCKRRNAEFADESRVRQEMQEKSDKLQRELDRCKKQLATSVGLSSSSKKKGMGDDDVQIEYLNSLLRCSACKDRYRDRIITRCLHTFCQECVDARIQTRQRKCPHCGLGFSVSDVQTLYLQ
ncbi:hypothetical protein CBS101457_005917 [Exobasidium rhododendri]|nr:hypothetical protein CBS101457_005917 [Exobasidium rhododendri]